MTAASWKSAVNGDWSMASDWSNNVVPGSTTDVTIGVAGAYDVTVASAPEAAHSITLNDASGTLTVEQALSLATTLTVKSGTLDFNSGGVIQGGTIINSGGTVLAQGGTLDGVTYQGVLTLAGFAPSLLVEGGLSLATAAGGQPGSIDLSGAEFGQISVLDSETLNHATLNFGSGNGESLSSGIGTDSGHTLTLGTGFTIDVTGGSGFLGGQESVVVDDTGDTLVNAGLIDVSGGALTVDYGTFTNTGSINVTGGVLDIPSGTTFTNTGSISISNGGVLDLAGTFTTAGLKGITASGGCTLEISGLLVNTGATLDIGAGSTLTTVDLAGTILGGTVLDSGSGLATQGGTLDGVTYQGVLTLAGFAPSLLVEGGLTLETAAGGQPGSIDLSGAEFGQISVLDSETLNHATLNFGSGNGESLSSGIGTDSGHTLTLGTGFTIDVTGGSGFLGGQESVVVDDTGDTLVNAGLIDVSGGALTVDYGTFTNTGSINVTGGVLDIPSGTTFTNPGSISNGGVLDLAGTFTTAGLKGITASGGGTLEISGLLVNTGATLDIGAGSTLTTVDLAGTVLGGTVLDSGSGLAKHGCPLGGVTYEGVLTLAGFAPSLLVEGGLTLETAAGGQPGSIDLSGAEFGQISVLDSETLNHATLNFGSGNGESPQLGHRHRQRPHSDSGHGLHHRCDRRQRLSRRTRIRCCGRYRRHAGQCRPDRCQRRRAHG